MIGLTGSSNSGTATVPMAFQSALAGIGLAADLVKHALSLPVPVSTSTRINLPRPLASILADPHARDATGRCICCDEDFIEAYRRKYPVGGSRSRRARRPTRPDRSHFWPRRCMRPIASSLERKRRICTALVRKISELPFGAE